MRYRILALSLASLLLMNGCTHKPQPHIQMPDEVYDHPPVEVDFLPMTNIRWLQS